MMKLLFSLVMITSCAFALSSNHGLDTREVYVIDAIKNARSHNNMGNIYFDEKNYKAALIEYKIAYELTKDKNISAVYSYNIARCMIKLERFDLAKILLDEAISKNCMNITYYQALVDCYIALKIQDDELQKHLKDTKNPYDRIVAGLIYLKTGQKLNAKILFDEFINDNPDMLISEDVKLILNKI